jgi:hypothetical protein
MGAESPYQRFWGQLIRWLANVQTKAKEAAPSLVMRLDRSYLQVGQTVNILARVQDERGRFAEAAQAACTITPLGKKDGETLPLAPRKGSGLFETTYRPGKEGSYEVKISASDSAGKPLGSDRLVLQVAPHSAEMDRLARDEKTLRLIAERSSDGRYADISGLPDVIDQLIERQKILAGPAAKPTEINLALGLSAPWDFTMLFLVFVALVTLEWLLRRTWHLQ